MNSKNSKTAWTFRDNINLRRSDKYVALSCFRIYFTWKNIKRLYRNHKFEMKKFERRMNQEFELTNASYSVSVI